MSVIASRFVIGRHEAISPFCRQCDSVLIYSISNVPHCVAISQQAFAVIARHEAISSLFPSFPFFPSLRGTKQSPQKKIATKTLDIHLNNKHPLMFSRNDVTTCFSPHCEPFRHCEARSNLLQKFKSTFPLIIPGFLPTSLSSPDLIH